MTAIRRGEATLGLIALLLAAFIGWGTLTAPASVARSAVGPGVFPALIAGGLFLVGLRLLWEARPQPVRGALPTLIHWPGVLLGGAALLLVVPVLPRLGWIVTATLLFMAVARAFEARDWLTNALIGLALASWTFLLFDTLLGLSLPVGRWLEPLLLALGIIR